MKKILMFALLVVSMLSMFGCYEDHPSADGQQARQQEAVMQEANRQVGMPAIANMTEKRLLKQVYELRDQADLSTFAYAFSEVTGKFTFLGNSIGFPVSAATQFTNPQKIVSNVAYGHAFTEVLPQADPNGLFSPAATEGSWVLLVDTKTGKAQPTYFETRISCSLFKLPDNIVQH